MGLDGFKFTEHIAELRARLKVIFIAFVIVLIVVVLFPANPVQQAEHLGQYVNLQFLQNTVMAAFIHQVKSYLVPKNWQLIAATGIGEPMEVYFVASILISLVLCMPVIAYEAYRFIDPALSEQERRLVYPFVASTTALFAVGVAFGYFVIAKFLVIALQPFFVATGTSPLVDVSAFYYVVFLIIGATGASFTAPVFVYTLIRLRVLDPEFFSRNRVVIWFIIWVVTGLFLTPDGGPLLDIVIFIPIVALVEGAVVLAKHNLPPASPGGGGPGGPRCAYCNSKLSQRNLFCPSCGKGVA